MEPACKAACWVSLLMWILADFTAESLENVAPSGIASQSSNAYAGYASRAIDGNRDPEYGHGSCTHTYPGPNPWWSLLLPVAYRVTTVSITNRNVAGENINNAEILIGSSLENNGNNNPRCAVISSIPNGGTATFNCTGMIGRMVNVKLSTSYTGAILTMCELELYGEPAAPSPSLSAVLMGRKIAVVQNKLCWSDALLYCREHYWDLLSVRSEQEQRGLEEVLINTTSLTNGSSIPSGHVWLGLRRRVMGSTWFWMSGAPMTYTYWKAQNVWQITSPCGGTDTDDSFYWKDFPCGDHLYFICLKDFEGNMERVGFYSFTQR